MAPATIAGRLRTPVWTMVDSRHDLPRQRPLRVFLRFRRTERATPHAVVYSAGHGTSCGPRWQLSDSGRRGQPSATPHVTMKRCAPTAVLAIAAAKQLRAGISTACRDKPFAKSIAADRGHPRRDRQGSQDPSRPARKVDATIPDAGSRRLTATARPAVHGGAVERHLTTPGLECAARRLCPRRRAQDTQATVRSVVYGSLGGRRRALVAGASKVRAARFRAQSASESEPRL